VIPIYSHFQRFPYVIGRIGVIDHDIVELSNLQRQILHTEGRIGMNKAQSVAIAIKESVAFLYSCIKHLNNKNRINSTITVDVMPFYLTTENALSLLAPYDIILDCTDNAPTRYLLSDTAVALTKPLISGAAQKLEGQLCTYNLDNTGPCYRCMFPKPPPAAAAATCEETGILGVVTGIIGNLQALEAIKIITGLNGELPCAFVDSSF
jgi:adenylyltransferase and sulfurtransferase